MYESGKLEPGKGIFDRDLQQAGAKYLRAKARRETVDMMIQIGSVVFVLGTVALIGVLSFQILQSLRNGFGI